MELGALLRYSHKTDSVAVVNDRGPRPDFALQKTGPRADRDGVGKVKDTKSAAREFEAMLIGQLMQSAFSSEQMGLSDENDSGGQVMLDFGREHLSRVIAEGGGLGLGQLIESGLAKHNKKAVAAALKR